MNALSLNLLDQTVTPATTLGITDFNLDITNISNRPGTRFPTDLKLQVASGGQLSLQGELQVLPQPQFEFDIGLDEGFFSLRNGFDGAGKGKTEDQESRRRLRGLARSRRRSRARCTYSSTRRR